MSSEGKSSLGIRLVSIAALVPVVGAAVFFSPWAITVIAVVFCAVGAWEFWRLFRVGGNSPALIPMLLGVVGFILLQGFALTVWMVPWGGFLLLLALFWHTISYQRGIETSAVDFCITTGGIFYLGFMGSYLVALRQIDPGGSMWLLLGLLGIALADGGAYFFGIAFGRHKLMSRVSPKKSWEGYLGGIFISTLLTTLIAWGIQAWSPGTVVQWWHGALLASILAVIAPMGDFGESMLKRQFGQKDSSNIIPGHGGILDRLDSIFWMGFIAYFVVTIIIF